MILPAVPKCSERTPVLHESARTGRGHGKLWEMPVRLIALDIDGTLLDERSQLPAINRNAVAEAAARGIEIALVTGRRYDFATPIARQFPCPLTMIVNNGALVKSSTGETQLVQPAAPRHRRARA